ncbi:periplasmic heavy metal sensor [Telmatospirillum sp.]|uniref:periplasmic heavy metal sensor n=1 Tax=Telmatospirillum sp. TaxID=2079197 RepID=UPI0028441934|nr:periplasmic heavy metal sensor [Telmatospirillum sp.]MDR3440905.1 periplasmic heavy metal sensor [Telmatospirillum sp.]
MHGPSRRQRTVGSIVLALSVGLNLFFAGWGVMQYFDPPAFSKPGTAPEIVAETIARSLPSADGEILRRAFAEKREPLQAARQRYLSAVERLRNVISSDPLDPQALQEAMAALRSTRQAERDIFSGTMLDVIPRFSLHGRQIFVETHMGGRS